MSLQAVFAHEGTSQNHFGQTSEAAGNLNDLQQNLFLSIRALVTFYYYNTNYLLEITSKVEQFGQKHLK